MAQKFVTASNATAGSRLNKVGKAAVQISSGVLAYLVHDQTNFLLRHSGSDHATDTAIATLTIANGFWSATNPVALCVDADDNLYAVGFGGTGSQPQRVRAQCWTKGAGLAWTQQAVLTGAADLLTTGSADELHAVWCGTGGGTNGKGHILLAGRRSAQTFYAILDAGALIAGAGVLVVNQGSSPVFLGAGNGGIGPEVVDLSPDGFGATQGICISGDGGSAAVRVGKWAVSSAGALSTDATITSTITVGTTTSSKARAIRYASNAWAVIVPSDTAAGRYKVGRWSFTAQLTAFTDSGAPTSMPLNAAALGWDAFLDPITASKVWIIALGTLAAGSTPVWRLGVSVGSGVTFDGAATADDTLTNTQTAQVGLRAVKSPRASIVDWQQYVQTAATPTYALDADYTAFNTAPNAPTNLAPANNATEDMAAGYTQQGVFSDPDASDTMSAYALRRKTTGAYEYWNAGTALWQGTEVWNALSVANGATFSVVFAAGKWTNATTYFWSFATKDAAGVSGPYAADFTVNASTAAVVTVTGPASPVTTTSRPDITWSLADPESDAQQTYDVRIESGAYGVVPGAGTAVMSTGELPSAPARSWTPTSDLVNGTTYRAFVRVKTNGQYSAWAYATFTMTLTAPTAPTLVVTEDVAGRRNVLTVVGTHNAVTFPATSFRVAYSDPDGSSGVLRTTAVGSTGGAGADLYDYEAPFHRDRSYEAFTDAEV